MGESTWQQMVTVTRVQTVPDIVETSAGFGDLCVGKPCDVDVTTSAIDVKPRAVGGILQVLSRAFTRCPCVNYCSLTSNKHVGLNEILTRRAGIRLATETQKKRGHKHRTAVVS